MQKKNTPPKNNSLDPLAPFTQTQTHTIIMHLLSPAQRHHQVNGTDGMALMTRTINKTHTQCPPPSHPIQSHPYHHHHHNIRKESHSPTKVNRHIHAPIKITLAYHTITFNKKTSRLLTTKHENTFKYVHIYMYVYAENCKLDCWSRLTTMIHIVWYTMYGEFNAIYMVSK